MAIVHQRAETLENAKVSLQSLQALANLVRAESHMWQLMFSYGEGALYSACCAVDICVFMFHKAALDKPFLERNASMRIL